MRKCIECNGTGLLTLSDDPVRLAEDGEEIKR
jgi:hypothetical protein